MVKPLKKVKEIRREEGSMIHSKWILISTDPMETLLNYSINPTPSSQQVDQDNQATQIQVIYQTLEREIKLNSYNRRALSSISLGRVIHL